MDKPFGIDLQFLDLHGILGEKDAYYSFDAGGVHFVVLAPNYGKVDGKYISYENGIEVKGTRAEFVGPSPEEMGAYDEGSKFVERGIKITAEIENRFLPLHK